MKFAYLFLLPCLLFGGLNEDDLKKVSIERYAPQAKIALVTAAIGKGFNRTVAPGTESKRAYCKRHGYDFIIGREYIRHLDDLSWGKYRKPHWTKVPLIDHFVKEYDWVFWTDADSMIMNDDIPLESFIDENYDLIVCREIIEGGVNTGQMLLKDTPWIHDLLREAWIEGGKPRKKGQFGQEQPQIRKIIARPENVSHVMIHDEHAFNTHPKNFQEGDFIVHFWGIPIQAQTAFFEKYRAIKNR